MIIIIIILYGSCYNYTRATSIGGISFYDSRCPRKNDTDEIRMWPSKKTTHFYGSRCPSNNDTNVLWQQSVISLAFVAVVCRRRSLGWSNLKVENVIEEVEFLLSIFLVLGLPEPSSIASK